MDLWAAGAFTAAFDIEMAVKNSAASAVAGFCKELLDIDVDDLENYRE